LKVIHSTEPASSQEKTLLVGLEHSGRDRWDQSESLAELKELVKTAGGSVAETVVQKLETPTAPFYIGKGKAEELARLCGKNNIHSVVFNDELTPAQSRNLEEIFKRKVIDRTQLILDIFAQRAKSKEGKLQIELAQLQYLLPRLTGMWTHLSRQSGGIGTRGPGETQLEVDRRRVMEKINRLERELEEVRRQRDVQRQGRLRQHWPIAALVGYTNAGKSTLLNLLTASEAYTADQLFATLDPTTRQFTLPNKQKVLLTDTVGFLQDLPHHLIESFKSTLEEVTQADVLFHVVDLSHPRFREQMRAVDAVLEELQASGKQTILIFNKVDAVANPALVQNVLEHYPGSVAISAKNKIGIDQLLAEIQHQVRGWRLRVKLLFPNHMTALIAELHSAGRVLEIKYEGDFVSITAHIPPQLQGKLKEYITESGDAPFGSGPIPDISKRPVT
jgi:GTP-binding protein HflX